MQLFKELIKWVNERERLKDISIGFIPTMGHLHRGHISLFEKSQTQNDKTIVSIFVNPTQFNSEKDFINYPNTLDADIELLKKHNIDYCLAPAYNQLYPDNYRYQIHETTHKTKMEGKVRPGHFDGVLTVVLKLLQIVRPTNAYFGEKDYQQFELIRDMAHAFFIPTTIIACPTVREDSKLAYSSRNSRLNTSQKQQADTMARLFHQSKPLPEIQNDLEQASIKVEYLEQHDSRRFIAAWIGDVRLIDNYAYSCSSSIVNC